MKEVKRRFKYFKYRECDAFAKYLEEQAAKGWHFKEWRLGLVFEKGEPRKVKYSVEVFPKGDDRDSRPEKDAEEFAEYCEAAGWKLIDGQRKFCIFKAIRNDAVPIATPEERYENICKAEQERLWLPLVYVPFVWIMFQVMWGDGYKFLFQNSELCFVIMMLILMFGSIVDGLSALLWRRKKKRQIVEGETPFYKKTIGIHYSEVFWLALIIVNVLRVMEAENGGVKEDILIMLLPVAPIFAIALSSALASFLKPSVEHRMLLQLLLGFGGILIMGGVYSLLSMQDSSVPVSKTTAPLLLEDFQEVTGERFISGEESETFLGKKYDYYLSYGNDELRSVQMQYKGCESPYKWVIDRVWKTREKWSGSEYAGDSENTDILGEFDCTELWGAQEAWCYQSNFYIEKYCYEIRYLNEVLVLRTMEELDAEDVKIIREKLELD